MFSALDASSGDWRIEVEKRDRNMTSSTSYYGLYRFTRILFDLKHTPGTFHSGMDVILAFLRWQFALDLFDDIVVILKSAKKQIEQVRRVLRLLYETRTTLKRKKCEIFAANIDYLGHVIRRRHLEPPEHTTYAAANLEHPTMQRELLSFLRLYSVLGGLYQISRFSPLPATRNGGRTKLNRLAL